MLVIGAWHGAQVQVDVSNLFGGPSITPPLMNVDASLDAIQTALATLESDAPLRDRVDAMQDLASLLRTVPILDGIDDAIGAGLRSQIYGRSVPSLLVSLMNECGEDHDASRNPICRVAEPAGFLSAEELLEDARLWALLTRMLQSGDDESVGYAVAAVRRFILDEVHAAAARRAGFSIAWTGLRSR